MSVSAAWNNNFIFSFPVLGALKRNAVGIIAMWWTEPIESINANYTGEASARAAIEALSSTE